MNVQPTRDQLRALANAATPGPWEALRDMAWDDEYPSLSIQRVGESWDSDPAHPCCEPLEEADAAFIASARTAIPQLLDQLDQAEAELDYWMTRAYEAEKRAWQAEARIKAVEDVLDEQEAHFRAFWAFWAANGKPDAATPGISVADIRRALDG